MKHQYACIPLALVFAASSVVGAARAADQMAVLPVDTVLKVRLDDTIGSDRSRPGDRFTASVEDPSLPKGTLVQGVVIAARPAVNGTPGRIGVDFQSLELPSGQRIPIAGTAVGLDTKSVTTRPNGRLVARSHTKGNTDKYIGYGAAGGLLIGSLLGKNVVGGMLGAGAGYLFGKHQAKEAEHRDVVLKEGTELGVRLDRGVVLARS
jgi:hypothetical protein